MAEGFREEGIASEATIERTHIERGPQPLFDDAEGGLPRGLRARLVSKERDPKP